MFKVNKKRAALLGVIALECGLIGGLIGYNLGHEEAQAAEPDEVIELSHDYAYTDYRSLGEFVITYYCPDSCCCGEYADGVTASGTIPAEGRTIAADPDVLPMGSTVIIDGHTYTVEDVGGAIKGNRIDIFMNSHEEALKAGVRTAEVFEEV